MVEEIGFENGRNSNFQGLMTLTLTLDLAIRHTVVHHSSTSTYIPNFIQIEETFYGRTDGRTDIRTDIFSPSNIIRSTFGSRPKKLSLPLFGHHAKFGQCVIQCGHTIGRCPKNGALPLKVEHAQPTKNMTLQWMCYHTKFTLSMSIGVVVCRRCQKWRC